MTQLNQNWEECRDAVCCTNHIMDFDGTGCTPQATALPMQPATINTNWEECRDAACCGHHGMEFDGTFCKM